MDLPLPTRAAEVPLWFQVALFLPRLLLLSQPGYIHPDEIFQAGELVAGPWLGVQSDPPWEVRAAGWHGSVMAGRAGPSYPYGHHVSPPT